ncbi:DUF2334 domain-containing protein [Pseudonocardia sp. HH130630-07]|uniref:DUF2334 domain-containing protein n=1 Tax=Pseudonocardia sp. HH130630-07 TaxID=1690815 RepID=UPI0008153CFB|nr:DUF2334 domain-containing protein [Pseudonocardia sp. HH130630-07]ANY06430.1 hypothetical protein AFB00_09145 [Pseudonocardia sp. HH130630-07]
MSTLLVSLSGLTDGDDADLARAATFASELYGRHVPLTHLVQPKGPDGPLRRGDALVGWITERVAAGDDLLLHGFDHTGSPLGVRPVGAVGRMRRRSEFGALPRHEATLRLTGARRLLAATGLSTDGFAPPGWAASPGTVLALADLGFTLCADETSLGTPGGPVHRAKVLTFRSTEPWLADRAAGDRRRGRALWHQAVRTAERGGIVRIAVRAKDLRTDRRVSAALEAIDAARAAGAVPAVHRGMVPALPAAA